MSYINLIPGEQGVRLSTLSPKYLHTNSTSHTWPFSAIAELIDNAYDPDVEASQLWIDIERYGFEQCLTFTDNGAGMDSLKLHKMLSFGFCEKEAKNDHLPVGHYGNGFKSGSMRLGKDAIVFTKKLDSISVGLLSQSYLDAVKAQTILVPIVSWDSQRKMVERADGDKALQDILKYSLFKTKRELLHQFNEMTSLTGTRIIISHMRRTQEGKYEFDFRTDYNDIRIPDDVEIENNRYKRQERQNHIPESDYSLRAYCSILYLRPRMQIILRGKKVRTTVIAKSLSKTEVDTYRPSGISKPIKVTFGFSQNKNHYGIMMYHRNRLIKPYVRVGYQLRANNLGVGVIGVIQCDYLQPTHNKQDFDYTKAYRASMSALGSKLNDYWNEKKGKAQTNSNAVIPEPKEVESVPDQLWVQCDNPGCLKWRKLPPGVTTDNLPEKWYCRDHPDKKWRSCDVPEELEEEDEHQVQPYVKKQKKRLEKELEDKKRREKDAKRLKELDLEIRRKELQKKEVEISRLMQQVQAKSSQQQSARQQGNVKPEAQSPQKLQIKLVGPATTKQQATVATTTKKYIVHQTSGQKVVLTPVSTSGTPVHTLAINTPTTPTLINSTVARQIAINTPGTPTLISNAVLARQIAINTRATPNLISNAIARQIAPHPVQTVTAKTPTVPSQGSATRQIVQKPQLVVVKHVTPNRPILQKPATPLMVTSNQRTPQQGATMVNIVSKGAPTPTGSKTNPVVVVNTSGKVALTHPAMYPKVSGPPVILKVTSQAAADQVKYLPTMVPVTAVIEPKVVSVQSLAKPTQPSYSVSMAMPGTSKVVSIQSLVKPTQPSVSMATPPSVSMATPPSVSMATPGTSNMLIRPAITPTNTNMQSPTLPVVSKALFGKASCSTQTAALGQTKTPAVQDHVTNPTPLGRHDVTVNNRYRYIAPSGQSTPQTNAASPQLTVMKQVKTEPQTVSATAQQTQTVVKTEPRSPNLKRRHSQNKSADEPVARKPKPDADIIIIDPPSPPPMWSISPVVDDDMATDGMATDDDKRDTVDIPNMDLIPDVDTSMAEVNGEKPEVDKSVPEVDTVIRDCNMDNIDKDVIDDVKSMSPGQQLQALLNRTQQLKQLYSLRDNVLKLLRVLVPELEIEELNEKYEDQTVDELLKQVLDQAEKSEDVI